MTFPCLLGVLFSVRQQPHRPCPFPLIAHRPWHFLPMLPCGTVTWGCLAIDHRLGLSITPRWVGIDNPAGLVANVRRRVCLSEAIHPSSHGFRRVAAVRFAGRPCCLTVALPVPVAPGLVSDADEVRSEPGLLAAPFRAEPARTPRCPKLRRAILARFDCGRPLPRHSTLRFSLPSVTAQTSV